MRAVVRLLLSAIIGLGVFILPLSIDGRWTVLFDVVVKAITRGAPFAVSVYCLAAILFGATASVAEPVLTRRGRPGGLFAGFVASPVITGLRLAGVPLAVMMFAGVGPDWLLAKSVAGLMWGTLIASVGVIIPIGAVALNLFVTYGCLELVGTLMRPVMRPAFRLPGRASLDNLASWIGSYSVGLYLTRKLFEQGRYHRREAFIIATCFSTVSIGFVGVVASTLGLLPLFPIVFGSYFVAVYLLAVVMVRVWPVTAIAATYVTAADPEPEGASGWRELLALAWRRALERAALARSFGRVAREGLLDGLRLTATILGTILAVGTVALCIAEYTPAFDLLGRPLVPVLSALGLPDAELLAPATVAGITEMYIPALIAKDAALPGRFFICVLSISQLIFFSSVAPMMIDMFRDVPIRARHLVAVFAIRTALLVPLLAGLTWVLSVAGMFG